MSRDQDPLTPEERRLADALAHASSRRRPSPQLDATILASARAAVARDTAPAARRPRRRWPAALGVAATLVITAGIAWQLRPPPPQDMPAQPESFSDAVVAPRTPAPAETAIGRARVSQPAEALPAPTGTLETPASVAAPPAAPPTAAASDDGGIVFERQELHDVPPATVDSPGIHSVWLDRIRELRDAGEGEAARESLLEFRRRYPGQPLPADLDGLLEE